MRAQWQSDGIALPATIEQALQTDTLVLFCGAGISAEAPSRLPGFRGLVEAVALELGRSDLLPDDPNAQVQFDAIMGELNELQHDVHARVSARLRGTTQPNSYHRDLIQISQSFGGAARIVTTNFDLLFEHGAEELGVPMPVYAAPALPLGNDFSGLVHLHGTIDPTIGQRMVVTDTDFGQAYITEGWATQFLTRMFERYVTLFVGYSADDTVMRYLARALPADGKTRFAFMEEEQADTMAVRWERLGVTPIAYPSPEKDRHASLKLFIENWRMHVTATPADRFDRVQTVLSGGPDGGEVPEHELLWMMGDTEHARHFWHDADAAAWIPRLAGLGVLDELFDASAANSDRNYGWAQWAVSSFAADHGATLLGVAARHGGRLAGTLWFHIWLHLHEYYQPIEHHRQWLLLLAADQPSRDDDRLSGLLHQVAEKDPPAAEVLLHHMLIPRLRFRPRRGWLGEQDSLDSDLVLAWRQSSIRDAWPTLLPSLADPDHLLSVVLDLIRGAESTDALFSGRDRRRSLSARRQKVDGVEEYGPEDPYVLVVDIARDLLREFVRREGTDRALRLLRSSSELIRRLSIDALGEAHSGYADANLLMLLDGDLIFDLRYKPEVFRLLRAAYRHASPHVKAALLAHIEQTDVRENGNDIRDYERYNVLVWLSSGQPGADPVHAALTAAQTAHPDYGPREHPDLDFWVSVNAFEEATAEAEGLFRGKPVCDVVAILAADSSLDDAYDNGPILRELRDYLDHHPGHELELLDAFLAEGLSSASAWTVVLQSAVRPGSTWQAEPLLARLERLTLDVNTVAYGIVFSITRPSHEQGELLENAAERCRLLLGLWRTSTLEAPDETPTDPSQAHSTARGALAYAYVETALRATQEGEHPAAIDPVLLDGFDELLAAQSLESADPSTMMLARYAGHIVEMAPEWSDRNLQPLLSSLTNSPRSRSFWAGVLTANYFTRSLMGRMREALRTGWPAVARSLPGSAEAFIKVHSAQFAFYTPAEEYAWADPFIASAPVTTRARWIRSVARHLDGNDPDFQDLLFELWQHRIDNQPPLHGAEQRALLDWLTLPNIDLDRAVDLFIRGPAVTSDEGGFDYYGFDDFPREESTAFLKVGMHLLEGRTTLPPFLSLLVEAATQASEQDTELAKKIWSRLLSLGYKPAREHLGTLELDGTEAASPEAARPAKGGSGPES
ncbi:SIR2 family protein [Leifsonia sp. 2TAF2]|uniref:SIR2 family protein n=1 Tax=Leifsonia sp. 2TAF2 TaxID=3233009 RepID=UPI003F9655CE